MERFPRQDVYLELYTVFHFQPMQFLKEYCNTRVPWRSENQSGSYIHNPLYLVDLKSGQGVQHSVAIIDARDDKRLDYTFCHVNGKAGSYIPNPVDEKYAGFAEFINLPFHGNTMVYPNA